MSRSRGSRKSRPGGDPMTEHDKLVLKIAEEKVTARSGSSTVELSRLEALLRKEVETAVGGSPHAQWHAIKRIEGALLRRREAVESETLLWRSYCARKRRAIDSGDLDPRSVFPHPDDIVFHEDRKPTFEGPMTPGELVEVEQSCRRRDAYIVQHALENALDGRRGDPALPKGSAGFIALTLNHCLPRRFRLNDNAFLDKLDAVRNLPKRDLLKQARAAWQAAGEEVPRGKRLPSPAITSALLDMVRPLAQVIKTYGPGSSEVEEVIDEQIAAIGRASGIKLE